MTYCIIIIWKMFPFPVGAEANCIEAEFKQKSPQYFRKLNTGAMSWSCLFQYGIRSTSETSDV